MGANLFVGNLDPDVDEKLLFDAFSAFGVIVATPKVCSSALRSSDGVLRSCAIQIPVAPRDMDLSAMTHLRHPMQQ